MGNKENTLSALYCSVDNNLNLDTASWTTTATGGSQTFVDGGNLNNLTMGGTAKDIGDTDLLNRDKQTANYTMPQTMSCYHWWTDWYYPYVIRESYPVYIQERAKDKGKQAYEIIKILKDKGLIEIDTVKKFMEAMDTLINIL